jgi:hypothetical protein
MTTATSTPVREGGPPLWIPAGVFAVLTIAAAALGAAAPWAGASPAEVAAYAAAHPTQGAVQAMLLFGSAFPLVVWVATAQARVRRVGVTVPGPTIGLVGGILAAAALVLSALSSWVSVQPGIAPDVVFALRTMGFAAGAAGFVVPVGLLLAGFAVPALLRGLLPRPLAWAGLAVAAAAVLATLTLVVPALNPLLPVGRFGGLLWILAASVLLPRGTVTSR